MDLKTRLVALAILAPLVACATGDVPGRLERLYPLGQAPPQDSIEIRFVRSMPIQKLAPRYAERAIERVGTQDTSLATEFYAYDASQPMGAGAGMHINRRCDYVLVDSERLVIGAFRVQEIC
jgi:hypothetical protein